MVHRASDDAWYCNITHSVSARLVHTAPHVAGAIPGLAATRFCGRPCRTLARCCFPARRVLLAAPLGPHGATSVAHVCRPTADAARRTASSAVAWAAKENRTRRSGPLSELAGPARDWKRADLSAELLDCHGGDAGCLACARSVR